MSVIVQHYYLAQCSLCPWESTEQRLTESAAEKDWIAHHNAAHGPIGRPACADHKPVQHRDGKPPWCKLCGLTADYTVPVSRFDTQPSEKGPDPKTGVIGSGDR